MIPKTLPLDWWRPTLLRNIQRFAGLCEHPVPLDATWLSDLPHARTRCRDCGEEWQAIASLGVWANAGRCRHRFLWHRRRGPFWRRRDAWTCINCCRPVEVAW